MNQMGQRLVGTATRRARPSVRGLVAVPVFGLIEGRGNQTASPPKAGAPEQTVDEVVGRIKQILTE